MLYTKILFLREELFFVSILKKLSQVFVHEIMLVIVNICNRQCLHAITGERINSKHRKNEENHVRLRVVFV